MKELYRIKNWSEYNKSLIQRGNIFLWFDEETIDLWNKDDRQILNGRPREYSDTAILCITMIGQVFKSPLRTCQGFVESILKKISPKLKTPNYTCVCRRRQKLNVSLKNSIVKSGQNGEAIHIVVDSTGLKVFGEGEWKVRMHGYSKRRKWRKVHIGLDEKTKEVVAVETTDCNVHDSKLLAAILMLSEMTIKQVSADGAYDTKECYDVIDSCSAKAVIPPREGAVVSSKEDLKVSEHKRNENIIEIEKQGKKVWKKQNNYHRRSLAENFFMRLKTIFTDKLTARLEASQKVEVLARCFILNRFINLGRPVSVVVS